MANKRKPRSEEARSSISDALKGNKNAQKGDERKSERFSCRCTPAELEVFKMVKRNMLE